uniref:SFRICE_041445 n=1 Tax=Spodoptera frugiperda TaxID=7108 RepID=A0A2H1WQB0_SPOFR
MRSAGLRSTSLLVTRTSPSAFGSTCVTLPLGQVLRGRSGSEVATSPTLGRMLLPRGSRRFQRRGRHHSHFRLIGDTGGTSFQLIDHACDSLPKPNLT